jgi:hypothetical protein
MPKRLTCDIDSSIYLGLAACAGWRSVECDRGDHRATVQWIAGMCGSTVKRMLLFGERLFSVEIQAFTALAAA